MDHTTTLVIGGTGKTGRRVVHGLTRRHHPVRIGSRTAGLPFDWDDPTTWAPALQGAHAAYITFQPDLAVPGAAAAIGELAQLAVDSGVRRLVLLSGRGEPEAEKAELALSESGADWTVLRASWFDQNFSESYLLDPVLDGRLALPAGTVPEPFVDADDIADVAVAALTERGHEGRTYELTGPRALTFADVAAEISAATGRSVDYLPLTPAEFAAELTGAGVPAEVVELLDYLFTTVLDGRNEHPADGVRQALGREPRDFADFARRTAATGVWNAR
ncbi:NAD(P)H-binding protein [Luteimicrobium sp. NPDC057192]|uniref:NAD(P)H-binding protein n=1 Tax=Luteimicrobium sp. NPDC057192 TaxID=3346042 RepID=UPI00363C70DE